MSQPYSSIYTGATSNMVCPPHQYRVYAYTATNMVATGVRTSEPPTQFCVAQAYVMDAGKKAVIQVINNQDSDVSFELVVTYLVREGESESQSGITFEEIGSGAA